MDDHVARNRQALPESCLLTPLQRLFHCEFYSKMLMKFVNFSISLMSDQLFFNSSA